MFCDQCGHENADNAKFCSSCGAEFGQKAGNSGQSKADQEHPKKSEDKRSVSLLLGLGIFFFPYFFAWVTLKDGFSRSAKLISFTWMIFLLVLIFGPKEPPDADGKISNSVTTMPENSQQIDAKQIAKIEKEDKERTNRILIDLKSIPVYQIHENQKLYSELVSLNPTNEQYKTKVEFYNQKISDNASNANKLKTCRSGAGFPSDVYFVNDTTAAIKYIALWFDPDGIVREKCMNAWFIASKCDFFNKIQIDIQIPGQKDDYGNPEPDGFISGAIVISDLHEVRKYASYSDYCRSTETQALFVAELWENAPFLFER